MIVQHGNPLPSVNPPTELRFMVASASRNFSLKKPFKGRGEGTFTHSPKVQNSALSFCFNIYACFAVKNPLKLFTVIYKEKKNLLPPSLSKIMELGSLKQRCLLERALMCPEFQVSKHSLSPSFQKAPAGHPVRC